MAEQLKESVWNGSDYTFLEIFRLLLMLDFKSSGLFHKAHDWTPVRKVFLRYKT